MRKPPQPDPSNSTYNSPQEELAFVRRVLDLLSPASKYSWLLDEEIIYWQLNSTGEIVFEVNCNDVFTVDLSDQEPLHEENLDQLVAAIDDVVTVLGDDVISLPAINYGRMLFCCRQRKMRPRIGQMRYMPADVQKLFEACGRPRKD